MGLLITLLDLPECFGGRYSKTEPVVAVRNNEKNLSFDSSSSTGVIDVR